MPKRIILYLIRILVDVFYIFQPVCNALSIVFDFFVSEWNKRKFESCGKTSKIENNIYIVGGKCIKIGNNTTISKDSSITAWTEYYNQKFTPKITIGDNCGIGERAHITAINCISIGNGVLLGKDVLITDNSHGDNSYHQLNTPPNERPLFSKGEVVIEDNVWIGEKASILPGIRIGKGTIVAACSVVTKNVPENCIVAGIPAVVVRKIVE